MSGPESNWVFLIPKLETWRESSQSINIFVTGKCGVGKSTLVNSVIGYPVAKEGYGLEPETAEVKSFVENIDGVQVTVWDSPGLQDGTKNEGKYLKDIKSKCKGQVDLFLYCIDMSQTRFVKDGPDMKAMSQLTSTLGTEMWKNVLVVLTFANKYIMQIKYDFDDAQKLKEHFKAKVDTWKSKIHSYLKTELHLDAQLVDNIQVVPAGIHYSPELFPNEGTWLSKLWKEAISVTKPTAQPALAKLNEHRLTDKDNLECVQSQPYYQQPLYVVEIGIVIEPMEIEAAGGVRDRRRLIVLKLLYLLQTERNGYVLEDSSGKEVAESTKI